MMQTLDMNIKKNELQQKQFIMIGGTIENQKKLSPEEIKQIRKNYREMYYGLTSLNWSKGMTLGMAWQKALEQIESFIVGKTKKANHPVNECLIKIHTRFKKEMSRHIMNRAGKESESKLSPRLMKIFAEDGIKMTQKGKDVLNQFYQKYMPQQNISDKQSVHKFEIVKQKAQQLMQQIMLQQKTMQRAA